MWPESRVKWEERQEGKELLSKQNNISNKQACGDISYLNMKDFSLSSHKEVSLQGGEDAGKFC